MSEVGSCSAEVFRLPSGCDSGVRFIIRHAREILASGPVGLESV